MAVQDTGFELVRAPPAPEAPPLRSVRRLPAQKDWPVLAIVAAQAGILAGLMALGQAAADHGWIDGFFWSKPSDIFDTLIKFFAAGAAWTDIGFTFRSTIFGFFLGTPCGWLLGLSFWWSRNYAAIVQPYIICFEALPKLALAPLVI